METQSPILLVPSKVLLLVAAVVWLLAGASVCFAGATAANEAWTSAMALGCALVFILFLAMFLSITRKHIRRIGSYTSKYSAVYKFFDTQSYVIMVVMIVFGALLRTSGLVPGQIIAPFYIGLGLALLLCGLLYAVTYFATCDELL